MGSTFNDTCYGTEAEALGAVCGTRYPVAGVDSAGSPVLLTCTPGAGAISVTSASSAASSATSFPVSFPVCDPLEHYADLTWLWGIGIGIAALIAVTRGTFGFLWKDF